VHSLSPTRHSRLGGRHDVFLLEALCIDVVCHPGLLRHRRGLTGPLALRCGFHLVCILTRPRGTGYDLVVASHTIIPFFLQLTSPGCLSVQPTNISHQYRLPHDLARHHQLERLRSLCQWQPMRNVWRDAASGKPVHEHREIPLLPGRVQTAQAANS
jgi:hypothetical protein